MYWELRKKMPEIIEKAAQKAVAEAVAEGCSRSCSGNTTKRARTLQTFL